MSDLFDNPAGLDGFEFIEFSAPKRGVLEPVFETMGFERVAKHRSKDVDLWRQGGINLITNYEPNSAAFYFAREHGPSACGMGFRVKDVNTAYDHLLKQGGEPVKMNTGPTVLVIPSSISLTVMIAARVSFQFMILILNISTGLIVILKAAASNSSII